MITPAGESPSGADSGLFGAPATCDGEEERDGLEDAPVNEFDER
jgi:hypothetical protein